MADSTLVHVASSRSLARAGAMSAGTLARLRPEPPGDAAGIARSPDGCSSRERFGHKGRACADFPGRGEASPARARATSGESRGRLPERKRRRDRENGPRFSQHIERGS